MSKVAVLTDTNSGITAEEAREHGIYVLPTPFYINDKLQYEGIDLNAEDFYRYQEEGADIKTSMPIVGDVMDRWNELLKEYDEVVYIPLSSGLSASCVTAASLAEEEEYDGRVFVVNNQRISVTMKVSAYEAKKLADEGRSGREIKEYLEEHKLESTIYIMVDTLKYLKKGGRLTPAVAAIGSLLKIKPVLQIQGDKLDTFAKARTVKQARTIMLDAIEADLCDRFNAPDGEGFVIAMAHTQNDEMIQEFREEAMKRFPNKDIKIDPLSLVVACHIGPGSIAITATKSLIDNI